MKHVNEIVIQNTECTLKLSGETSKITSVIENKTGTDIIDSARTGTFCYVFDRERENRFDPVSCEEADGVLRFAFACGGTLWIRAEARDRYFVFRIVRSDFPKPVYGVAFACAGYRPDTIEKDAFCAVGYAMNTETNPVFFPDAKERQTRGEVYAPFGIEGGALALIAAPKGEHRDIMKEIMQTLDKKDAILTHAGGAYALDFAPNYGDYVIVSDSEPALIPSWVEFYGKYGVDQLDFHRGVNTMRQGDFYFHKTGSAEKFKELVADPLKKGGIGSGLHTYAFYLDYNADPLLSDPVRQKQLEVRYEFTLKQDLKKKGGMIPVEESTGEVSYAFGFKCRNAPFLLIDEELVGFSGCDQDGFVRCRRGAGGTAAAEHKKGARVKVVGGYYSMIAPVVGSELYFEVARNTAKAYNEAGFEMIYLDAFDGIRHHVHADEMAIYAAQYVKELINHCETDPLLEYSFLIPSIWYGRGRMNAWDSPSRSYKEWNKLHIKSNRQFMDRHYTTTMGWYVLYPHDGKYPGNYQTRYHFFDDVDQMASLAVANDCSMVYQGLTPENIAQKPAFARNAERYYRYSRLRKSGYFSQRIKDQVASGPYEYALLEKGNGEYAFVEKAYAPNKLHHANEQGRNLLCGTNPFAAQKPFIRIENYLSSAGEEAQCLLELDESRELNEQTLSADFEPVNITGKLGIKVRVLGNNSDDAICISLKGYSTSDVGVAEYLVRLNFSGYRDFIFGNTDNGEFNDLAFEGKPKGSYEIYRTTATLDKLIQVKVYRHGACAGVKMSGVYATKHIAAPVTNPTLRIKDRTIVFGDTIDSTEYLEYDGEKAHIYDSLGNAREAAVLTGEGFTVDAGEFNGTFACQPLESGIPHQVKVTLGFTGSEIKE